MDTTLKSNEEIISFFEMNKEQKLYFIKFARKITPYYLNVRRFYNNEFKAYIENGRLKGIATEL